MNELACRFGEEGYIAITPDLYTREGRPAPDKVLETLFSVPDSQTMGDLEGVARGMRNSRIQGVGKLKLTRSLVRAAKPWKTAGLIAISFACSVAGG